MQRLVIPFVFALMFAWPVFAQQGDAPPTDPIAQDMIADWTAEARGREHTAQSLQKLIRAYQKAEQERSRLTTEVEGWKIYAKPLYEK